MAWLTNAVSFLALALGSCLVSFYGSPFKRGFYCDDETLRKPFKNNTVSGLVLIIVSIVIPPIIGFGIEKNKRLKSVTFKSFPRKYISATFVFYFGLMVTLFITQVSKYSVGRLRPNFFDVCRPSPTADPNCRGQYIEEFECTNSLVVERVMDMNEEVRKSFFSGHASLMAHGMIYLCLVISRATKLRPQLTAFKIATQTLLITLTLWVGYTRVNDNWHHWQDVAVGLLVGTSIAFYCARNLIKRSDQFNEDSPTNAAQLNNVMSLNQLTADREACVDLTKS